MSINPDELLLNENYTFTVTIRTSGGSFAGELELSPKRITLTISGEEHKSSEEHKSRKCDIPIQDMRVLSCTYLNATFMLVNLQFVSRSGMNVEFHPEIINFFTMKFEAEYVIYSPNIPISDHMFTGIQIYSSTIHEWLGNTTTQEDIINRYYKGTLFSDDSPLVEFITEVHNQYRIGVCYEASSHHMSPNFSAGINFPPVLFSDFASLKSADEIVEAYNDVYSLFAFLTGDELTIDKVLIPINNPFPRANASLYYQSAKTPDRSRYACILFPLGKNLRYDLQALPELPLSLFEVYFALDDTQKEYIAKYIRYRRMANPEDRFLGYFRILERLCYIRGYYLDEQLLNSAIDKHRGYLIKKFGNSKGIKSFLKNLSYWNSSKYNTEKCILEFIKSLPKEQVQGWRFKTNDVTAVCKLRNDITHANKYTITDTNLERYTKFIEVLLNYALMRQLNVNYKQCMHIVPRLIGYHLIGSNEKRKSDDY